MKTSKNEKPKPGKKLEPPLVPTCGTCNQLMTRCKCKHNELKK